MRRRLIKKPARLKSHIIRTLEGKNREERFTNRFSGQDLSPTSTSSVLFLLGNYPMNGFSPEPSIILNKRSKKVAQPGDLCFPGGGVAPRLDPCLSRLMTMPGMPLYRWPYWKRWKEERPQEADWISLMMATCLRESFEEMRLSPLGVKFLGPLPSQCLRMFKKRIYPMVGWGDFQHRFYPNWEVDKIVTIPISSLLDRRNYARFRLVFPPHVRKKINRDTEEFPCFIIDSHHERETLWGVTFRIVTAFLQMVFDFRLPEIETLPVVSGSIKDDYMGHSH